MRHSLLFILITLTYCTPSPQTETKVDEKITHKKDQQPAKIATTIETNDGKKEIVCFVYHRFGDSRSPSTNVSISAFESHLRWLASNNFQVLSLSESIEYMRSGTASKKTAVITIDDGYKSFMENGLPLLERFHFPATLFINTETVGAGDYLDWSELKIISQRNIEIGNHTHSHAYFLSQPDNVRYSNFVKEIEDSQLIIKQSLGITPTVFAYPYGEFDPEMKTIVKALGFTAAVAQNSGVIDNTVDFLQLPRFPMSEAYANMFEEKANAHPLEVISKSPESFLLPKRVNKPTLRLTINSKKIIVDRLQCYVQDGKCSIKVLSKSDTSVSVLLQAASTISNRRRTLYTITAPDSSNQWYWFSHLWINPRIE